MLQQLSAITNSSNAPPHITMMLSPQTGSPADLLATSGDYLRIWRVFNNEARQEFLLNSVGEFKEVYNCTFSAVKLLIFEDK